MRKVILSILAIGTIAATSCKKTDNTTTDTNVTETEVLNDFVQNVAVPQYQNLHDKAVAFNNAIVTLNSNPTDDNLNTARSAWKDTRMAWEQCEGYLFGPVEDDNYDPNMDTWPVDKVQMDSLLASSNPLEESDIKQLNLALRGFHPIEYILWGTGGNNTAANITAREKKYMISLSADILDNTTNLMNSWLPAGGNFQQEVLLAGNGSERFKSKQEAILAIVGAMADICDEVGAGKISEPFTARDSTLTESPFSHNSMIDFRNNIIGAQNVYLCSYQTQGKSLSSFVASRNASLDNKIRQQFTAAQNALNNVSVTFEQAIYLQPTQVQNAMDALSTLQNTLNDELKPFIQAYVKD